MPINSTRNTQTLKIQHGETYRRFFEQNGTIVSVPFFYELTTGWDEACGWQIGGPIIFHNIPFRFYIGLRPTGIPGTISIGSQLEFDKLQNTFNTSKQDYFCWKPVLVFLTALVQRWTSEKKFPGFEINILSEFSQNSRVSTSPEMALIVACALIAKLYTPAQIHQQTTCEPLPSSTMINTSKIFHTLFQEALELTTLSFFGLATGSSSYAAFFRTTSPIAYWTQNRTTHSSSVDHFVPVDVSSQPSLIRDLAYAGMRIGECQRTTVKEFPFDVVSLFPGSDRDLLPMIEHMKTAPMFWFGDLEVFVKNVPNFFQSHQDAAQMWMEYQYKDFYDRLFVMRSLEKMYQHSLSEEILSSFCQAVNRPVSQTTLLQESSSSLIWDLMTRFQNEASRAGALIAFRPLSWGQQPGNLFILTPSHSLRNELLATIASLQRKKGFHISADYVSWRDGWELGGVLVEQDISHAIISPFLEAKSLYTLSQWQFGKYTGEYLIDDQWKNQPDFDVLFDDVHTQVFISGKIFSSKYLPTKKATIELFEFLLRHINTPISNKELPLSTYAQYRNEFQGKIISPLNKLLEEQTGKSLGIKVLGPLHSFTIEFKPKDLNIGFINRR